MDIMSLSSVMSNANTLKDVGTSMMKKAIDQTEQMGQQITEMIDESTDSMIDVRV